MGSQRHHESKIFYNLRFFFDFEVALDVFFLFCFFVVQAIFFRIVCWPWLKVCVVLINLVQIWCLEDPKCGFQGPKIGPCS